MRRALVVSVSALVVSSLSTARAQDVPKDAFATVGSATITKAQVAAATQRGTPAQALQRLIQGEFLRVNLLADGVDPAAVTDAEFKAGLDEAKAKLRENKVDFDAMLERSGQTREQFEGTFRYSVAFMKYVESQLTDATLERLYETHKMRLAGELRASHLFVKITKDRDAAAAEARARELIATLLGDTKDRSLTDAFNDRVAESDDPMAALTGGDLDWFSAKGRSGVPIPILMAAFKHGKRGLVPQPARSRDGWHVIVVTAIKLPASATYEALRPKLRELGTAERAQELLVGWRARTPIHYAADAPGKPPTENR